MEQNDKSQITAGNKISRRNFIGKTALGIAGTAISTRSALSTSAASHKRIIGANERINIGFLGCGGRGRGHQNMVKMSVKDRNLGVVAVCDIWKINREKAAERCKKLFGNDVAQFKYSEDILKIIANSDQKYIREVKVLSIYEGAPIPEGKKSISIKTTFAAKDKTLSPEEIENLQNKVIADLNKKGYNLR